MGRMLYNVYLIIEELFIIKEKPLLKIYGEGTYVLITGATDGIGLGFAQHFAKRGFNLIISARNQEKLERRRKEILALYPKVKIELLEADYSKLYQRDFMKNLWKKVEKFDISILVNNVGIGAKNVSFLQNDYEKTHSMVTVNCTTQVLMTRFFLDKITEARMKKNKKSGIIDVSSIASSAPLKGEEIYCATKIFNDRYSRTMWHRHRDFVDHLIVKPGYVSTPLTDNREIDLITCDVDEAVNTYLKVFGHRLVTFGHPKHVIFGHVFQGVMWLVSYNSLNKVIGGLMDKIKKATPYSEDEKLKKE